MKSQSEQPRTAADRTPSRRRAAEFESDSGLSIVDVFQLLWRRKWFIVLCTAVASLIAYSYARSLTPVYEASASLRIDQDRATSLGLGELAGGQAGSSTDMPTEIAIITSDQVAMSALNSLPDDNFKKVAGVDKSTVASFTNKLSAKQQQERALNDFESRIRIKQVGETQILTVSFRDADPELAAIVVNQVIAAYIRQNFEARFASVTQVSALLNQQLKDLGAQANEAQSNLANFQEKNGILATVNSNTTTDTLKVLDDRLTAAKADRIVKEAQMRAAQNGNPSVLAALYPNPKLQLLQTDQGNLYGQYAQLSAKFGQKYAALVELKRQMQEIDNEINRDVQMVQSRLSEEYTAAKNTEEMLQAQYEEQSQKAYAMNREQSQLAVLQAKGNASRELYNTLQLKLEQAGINAGLNAVNTMPLDKARAPIAPVEPQKNLILAFGTTLGLIVGVASTLVVEASVNHVQNAQQLSATTGYRTLTTIAHVDKKLCGPGETQPGTMPLTHPNSLQAESYRKLRNLMMQSGEAGGRKTLMIASSKPGEGKTTITVGYGIALAQMGAKVLLVDADLRRPSLHLAFSMSNEDGLSQALSGGQSSCIFKTPVIALPNLNILTAGHGVDLPSEALASSTFRLLLQQWAKDFDHVVVKTAPLLVVSDGLPLAGWVDGVLLVARKDVTELEGLKRIRDLLDQIGADVLGIIINDVNTFTDRHENYLD